MRRIFICLLFLFALAGLAAQYPAWTNYTWGAQVWNTCSDAAYTWVATGGGLVRVDRVTLETTYYNHANFGLPVNYLDQVEKDSLGNLWVLHWFDSILSRFDGTEWESFICTGEDVNFTGFALRGPNDIWLQTENAGLFHFDGAGFTQYTDFFAPYGIPRVQGVSCDALGRVWFGTVYLVGGPRQLPELICYDGTEFNVVDPGGIADYYYASTQIVFDDQNVLWLGTQSGGLWRYDGDVWTNYTTSNSGLTHNRVDALALDPWGRVWVGSVLGVDCFDGNSWQQYTPDNSTLPSGIVYDISFDSDGIGWFATYHNLSRWQNGVWQVIPTSNSGFSYKHIQNQTQDAAGTHWFANWSGLDWFDGQAWGHVDLPGQNDRLYDLEFDSQGRLWLATQFQGLLCYADGGFTSFTPGNSDLPDVYVNTLAIDSQDRIWLGFPYEGVACLNGTAMTVYNAINSPLPSDQVTALKVDSEDRVWVGMSDTDVMDSWLAVLDDGVWTVFDSANSGLPGTYIHTIEARDGWVWVGTNQGLARFDGSSWEVWTEDNSGLPSNSVRAITFDSYGHLFAGTMQGLTHHANGDWTVWDTSNSGIADNGCRYLMVEPSDQIWIGNNCNGVSVFDHGASGASDPTAAPVAQSLTIRPNPFSSTVSLSGTDPRLEMEISLFNLRGQKLAEWRIPAGQEASLDLASKGLDTLPTGIYLWKADTGKTAVWGKSLKSR
jgi:sugar lactone lactonase YvrE